MVILDIDKPVNCYNCPCRCSMDKLSYCAAREYKGIFDGYVIPEWCPIETVDEAVLDKIRELVDDWQTHYVGTENGAYEYMLEIAELFEPQESEELEQ